MSKNTTNHYAPAVERSLPQTRNASVLIIEDDTVLQNLLEMTVTKLGQIPIVLPTEADALHFLASENVDLILLGIRMPEMGGFELCQKVRCHTCAPIIVISAIAEPDTVAKMLELGADEYIKKPFVFRSFEAILLAYLRRIDGLLEHSSKPTLQVGPISLDIRSRTARVGRDEFHLSNREFRLLHCLMQRPGTLLHSSQIYAEVWGRSDGKENQMIPAAIQRLRTKIEQNPTAPRIITNVRGFGYRVEQKAQKSS